ncbi:hypothetical protein G6F57_000254 [Rhizopus arrhizus]|nr:hypothetical protein G6F23_001144 [Rhizopus arrhizus]KAG1011102.1 hypothetical protein G6F27_004041 [Rhizopus arrhizus]KAG1042584.1 hypothetical protein G6F25_003053 [Rhizopus arrhizus]KAG1071280.1 hypothetical protein G6F41_004459 [Rhizopus arrhizus]KAG1351039.1 hypothetical protein G6F63_003203 [Rhizopus arrhizus]
MEPSKKEPEPSLRKLLDFADYQTSQKEANLKQQNETDELEHVSAKAENSVVKPKKKTQAKVRDLVIEQGLSARKAGFIVGIVERTAQHYVKQCKDDAEKRLPGQRKQIKRHLVLHASLTFKKLGPVVAAITAQSTLELRRERVLERQNDSSMNWNQNCVSIDETGFNMHIRRNFGWSKKGMSVKLVVPSNRGLTLRKPKVVQKKTSGTKKRKRDSGEADEVELNAREGTQSEHF